MKFLLVVVVLGVSSSDLCSEGQCGSTLEGGAHKEEQIMVQLSQAGKNLELSDKRRESAVFQPPTEFRSEDLEKICIGWTEDENTAHEKEEKGTVTATLFTKNGKEKKFKRPFGPESIFFPSKLNLADARITTGKLKSARVVSNRLFKKKKKNGKLVSPLSKVLNLLTMTWGQFIDHDIAGVLEEPHPVDNRVMCNRAGTGDQGEAGEKSCDNGCAFVRFPAVCQIKNGKGTGYARVNELRGFVEGHNVYGTGNRTEALRDPNNRGRLLTQSIEDKASGQTFVLPPFDASGSQKIGAISSCGTLATQGSATERYFCGDFRCGENLALLAMHTLWVREHNLHAERLENDNPGLDAEAVFQNARALVVGEIQNILVYEDLPALLGKKQFESLVGAYTGYDPKVNPSIDDAFAGAFYRFGHTLIPEKFKLKKDGKKRSIPLQSTFFNNGLVTDEPGLVDAVLKGESTQASEDLDILLAESIRNNLFNERGDLGARNIQRARDHQLHGYNKYREEFNLKKAKNFESKIFKKSLRKTLAEVYESPDDCDLFACMLAEERLPGAQVGELLAHALARAINKMRAGDPLWFENEDVWRKSFIKAIRPVRLADVMARNIINFKSSSLSNSFKLKK